ncbi:hypothetical protein TNCV_3972011 [Trichonephila clavipes]|nr:hypothetical protein TNCV_3972011 [Trichonephila clavipes]
MRPPSGVGVGANRKSTIQPDLHFTSLYMRISLYGELSPLGQQCGGRTFSFGPRNAGVYVTPMRPPSGVGVRANRKSTIQPDLHFTSLYMRISLYSELSPLGHAMRGVRYATETT